MITKQVAGFVQHSTLSVEIVTLPFKWKVKRTDTDFQTLRDYLLRVYPQTIIPPIPKYNPKKRLHAKQLLKK